MMSASSVSDSRLTQEESPLQVIKADLGELDNNESTQPVDRLQNSVISYLVRFYCEREVLTVAAAAPLVRHPRELTSAL